MTVLNGIAEPIEAENLCRVLGASYEVPVLFDGADMSNPASIRDMVERVGRSFGAVDILVNNAGIQHVAPVDEFPEAKWDAILSVNLSAAFHMTKAVLPEMKRRGFGRIVSIASAHGLIGSPFKSAYVAAKHGIVGLTKVVALEGAGCGVTCNAVCPGYVWTPLVESQVDGQAKAHGISRGEVIRKVILAEQPTKRFVTIEEVAGTTLFLCSEMAASVTGVALPVDGGWTAHSHDRLGADRNLVQRRAGDARVGSVTSSCLAARCPNACVVSPGSRAKKLPAHRRRDAKWPTPSPMKHTQ